MWEYDMYLAPQYWTAWLVISALHCYPKTLELGLLSGPKVFLF